MKKFNKKAFLVALVVSLVLLVVAVAATLLFDYYNNSIQFDTLGLVLGHAIGFLLLFFIVYRYEAKEDTNNNDDIDHNIY